MNHTFCRYMLSEQMKVVRDRFSPEQIKKAWAISTINSFEFHGPNGEYIYNLKTADCIWSAKAEGWARICSPQDDKELELEDF